MTATAHTAHSAAPARPPVAVSVRFLRLGDVEYAALLHQACLAHGFFSTLGLPFLRAYHAAFASSPYAVALVATYSGSPAGIGVGTVRNRVHYRWVLRHHGLRLALLALAGLLRNPRTVAVPALRRVGRYARALRRLGGPVALPDDAASGRRRRRRNVPGVLTHVAVAPGMRGLGVGTALCERFLAEAAGRGVTEVRLVTEAGPAGAGAFYARTGWQRRGVRDDWDTGQVEAWSMSLRGR
jgi:GNAT superfamily N-acetyltransferase